MFVFVKIFILFFFNVICCIHVGEFKKSLEELQTQVDSLSETDKRLPFVENLLSFLPNLQTSIKEIEDMKLDLKDSMQKRVFLISNNQNLKAQRIDLSNQLINSQSKLQTAEKSITEKDKKIKAFKSSRSKLQKVAYVTTIIA